MPVDVYLLVSVIFLINPLLGILLGASCCWDYKQNKYGIYLLIWMLAIYMAFINTTKIPISDMLEYQKVFFQAKECGIVDYIQQNGKEPIFYALTYICYYLFGGNWNLYVMFLTLLYYLIINYSIVLFGKKCSCSSLSIVIALIVGAFFFQIFIMTGHLIRQCLAEAFFIYFLIRKFVIKRTSWWVAILALGMHSSVLPLIGISLLPQIKRSLTIKEFLKGVLLLVVLALVFFLLESVLSSVFFLAYLYSRVGSENLLGKDVWQTESGVGGLGILLGFVVVFMIFSIKRKMRLHDNGNIVNPLINNCLCLIFVLCILSICEADYLLLRYFFYLYSYFSLLLVIFLDQHKSQMWKFMKISLVPLFIVYFMYSIDSGVFCFELSWRELLGLPLIFYPLFL